MTKELPSEYHDNPKKKFLMEEGKKDGAQDAKSDFLSFGYSDIPPLKGKLGDLMMDPYGHGWSIGYREEMRKLKK